MRASVLGLVLAVGVGCGAARVLTRPGGDGGWGPARRGDELATRAAAARVALDGGATAEPTDDRPLSLADVVDLAARESRQLAEADRDVAAAAARVRQARGRLFPRVTGQGRWNWYTDQQVTGVELPQPALANLGGVPPVVVVREADFGTVNGTATVPIDVWGEITKELTATQAGYRAEEARRFGSLLAEQVAAVASYFAVLELERLRGVIEETLAAQRVQLANAESRVAAGRLTRNELLVVQVAVRNTEQLLRQQDVLLGRARRALNQVIGRPVDAPTLLADVTARPDLPSAPDALREAYAHNPVLVALVEEQQRLEDTASALARSRLPQLQGGGTIDYTTAEVLQPQRVGGAFLGFNWTFDTGGRKEARIAEARIAADRNRVRIERSLREVEAAVRATRDAAEERLAALATAETAVQQAEENLRIRTQQFDVGRATSENVLDAQALLAEERASQASALYQAHTRRAELQRVMGLPLDGIVGATR